MNQGIRNFNFQNPTKILFGKDRIKDIDAEIPKDAKVLVMYGGGSVKRNGAFDRTIKALGEREWDEFGGIEANPTYETLMKAVEKIQQEGFTYLMAIGGGSVIDGTKFVSLAAVFDGDPIDIMGGGVGRQLPVSKAMPFGTVLTLPATASEMNNGFVITFVEKKAKIAYGNPLCFPQFSVLEPELTYTLPKRQLVNGVIDAFVHTMECYLTYPINAKIQDRYAEGILQTLIEIAPTVIDEHNHDYPARANFMWAATNALNGFITPGVPQDWASHMLGHEMTLVHGIDHGRTLSIILPAMMRVRKQQKWDKLIQYGRRVWNLTGADEDIVEGAIEKTEAFFQSLGAPTCFADVELGEECIDELLAGLERHGKVNISERGDFDLVVARRVYETAL
ncbi:NADP-dependent alcohol dehydrogenase [Granulicatella balaenopterae]|uniref:NADP-dependent alcohol dehydrogenase n=1 Tax=Granulicatella balaenopterae TaxID=137733 RepID=A0A1H9GT67_9LACT|nr:iron-containing alcohol dehydrogenase [Granulicatella balaenopterae]SEQ53250.1 NADP-dependent alcohol dehydrogenase [Granulicatella balaenopterae]